MLNPKDPNDIMSLEKSRNIVKEILDFGTSENEKMKIIELLCLELENTDVIYGAGISDGNRHNHDELPVLLVGGKNKGKHFRVEKEKPMCDLFVSLLHKHNVDVHHFGDSTGELNVV